MICRSFFLNLANNPALRAFAERSGLGRQMSRRFVAGTRVADAVAVAEALNREGIEVALDSLTEDVRQVAQAEECAAVYHELLDAIAAKGLRANISVTPSQMGIDIGGHGSGFGAGPELAERIAGEIVEHAAKLDSFVRIDMESSEYTEETLALTERLHARWPENVGTVVQAYLYRTADDIERLLGQGVRLRLCKGAFQETAKVAFAARADVDQNFVKLMKRCTTSGVFCGIATHDEVVIEEMRRFVAETGMARDAFEFQMLYGVRRDLQKKLVAEGFSVRVYVPFGREWYPYLMRRVAERPANAVFLVKNFFRK